jgi:mannose-6-phosphate isomerase
MILPLFVIVPTHDIAMFFQPKRIEKPWGHEIWFAHADTYVGKIIHVRAGQQLSLQYHERKDETLHCLQGDAVLVFAKDGQLTESPLLPGQSFRVLPGTTHRLRAGSTDCDILEASTAEVDDVVRVQDDYGRAR